MSKIRSSKTGFERRFIAELKKRTNKKFKANVTRIRGKPDIVFENEGLCIFLDSDFWHGWRYPKWKNILKNEFWKNKIEGNRKRDGRNATHLRKNGWTVLRIWGHQIEKDFDGAINKIIRNL